MQNLKIAFLVCLLMVLTVVFSRCFKNTSTNDPRGDLYAGSETCINCHRQIAQSYSHSDHYKTSSAINSDHLKKLTGSSKDRLVFMDTSYIRIEEDDNFLFQSYFVNGEKKVSGRFDIAFGSAEKAQTYGTWKGTTLYQLPLTYFTSMHTWANSPGFTARRAYFGRVIGSRCFECHASYVDKAFVQSGSLSVSESLDQNSIIYGIDCERCHGPALAHVRSQQENPSIKQSKYIVSIRSLTRQQQLDLCAVCHSGNDQSTQRSLFAFRPGDTLSHFYYPDFGANNGEPDVHGKQLQLLRSSSCFQHSDMTCTSCHNSHAPEQNTIAVFISKCMDCHQHSVHAVNVMKDNDQKKRDFNLVSQNCIDCHMPLQTSKTIYFNNNAGSENIPYIIRTHKIAIYK